MFYERTSLLLRIPDLSSGSTNGAHHRFDGNHSITIGYGRAHKTSKSAKNGSPLAETALNRNQFAFAASFGFQIVIFG
jgi:hypothetical protein